MKDVSELTVPQKVTRRLLEKDIQKACVDYARSRGVYARKFSSPANRSVPDYIFLSHGHVWFVEFKKPGGTPTDAQLKEHAAIFAARGQAFVVDSVEEFKAVMRYVLE